MRIASFNANSIRSRIEIILNWMQKNNCDVLCVQETKVTDKDFPEARIIDAGYNCVYAGQKSYNGVAIISKEEPQFVRAGLDHEQWDAEARIIRANFDGVTVVNTYIPQGTAVGSDRFQYKLDWINGLRDYFSRDFSSDDSIVWVGDFNVALEPIDVYDPEGLYGAVCYNPEEHKALKNVMEWGFTDVFRKYHQGESNLYSFWDYRVPNALKRRIGWRLDHIMATSPIAEKSVNCWIDTEPRLLEKPSDHTFIAADFNIG